MINLVESSPTATDSSAANVTGQNEAEASNQVDSDRDKVNKVWTLEYDLALLEEVETTTLTFQGHRKKQKIENVTQDLMNCGIPFKNPKSIMDRFNHLKRSHASKMAMQ